MHRARTRTFATNSLFAAFSLSILGWGLLHAWALQARTGAGMHVLLAIPGLAMCAIVLVRQARHWPAGAAFSHHRRREERRLPMPGSSSLAWAVLLLATGIGLAWVVAVGSALLIVLAALGMGCMPWTRVPVCRDHFHFAAGLVAAGAALGLALPGAPLSPLDYTMSALLFLCTASLITVFIVLMHGNRRDRMSAGGY